MRKLLWITTVIIFLPVVGWCQQSDTKTDPKQQQQAVHGAQGPQSAAAAGANSQDQGKNASQDTASGSDSTTPQPITEDALAAAARKSREQKKESGKSVKVFTNDNIPSTGGSSSLAPASAETATAGGAASATPAAADEKAWRQKFADLHHKLDQDKENLEVMQRELGILDVQYYGDPVKAMQQQYSREDINKKTAAIDAKKKEIDSDQQAIDDAEDALRKAGGDPGWAR
jgi:hypothetical protein